MPILAAEAPIYPEDLFSGDLALPWWVAHVRARTEKKLARRLGELEVPFYLPQRAETRTIAGRKRTSHLPLFPGYVFLRGEGSERRVALESGVVVGMIPVEDQARLERELADLWGIQQAGIELVPHPYLEVGQEVEVVRGPLTGYRGIVTRERGATRLVLSVTLVRQSVSVEVDRDAVRPVGRR